VYVTSRIWQRTRVAACAIAMTIAAHAAQAQTAGAPAAAQPAPGSNQDAAAQQIRDELNRLRQEFEAVRDTYGSRLTALETKLGQLQGAAAPAAAPAPVPAEPPAAAAPAGAPPAPAGAPGAQPPTATPEVGVPQGAAGAGGPEGALPVYGNASALSKIFNPDMAVIGNFTGAAGKNHIDERAPLDMGESEASFQAIVDPYARADFFFSFSPEGVEVEEGFITFTSLPGGLLAKVGKFREQIGKVNTMHAHVLPWVDEPLVLTNLLGSEEGISDSGISVSKLLMNPWFFLEATGEVYQGNAGLFQSHERSDLSYVGRVRGYRDITEGTNLDLGASYARGHNDAGPDFTTQLYSVDATVRYRPLRRAIYRRVIGRTELFWSKREQDLGDASAFGMYASGEYQFGRRWFAGGRYDWSERAIDPLLKDKAVSAILTYWPSEFSQVRGQYRRTKYAEGVTADELLFQFLFSIGAHGAHVF
jgi:hypothetical protein